MVKDIANACKTLPEWESYQKGLEVLANSLASINSRSDLSRKSMTVGDLIVKVSNLFPVDILILIFDQPIQRICRYPLLFAELLKQTPVCDSPNAHVEIEKVLVRLRESTVEMNKVTNDPRAKPRLEKTWLLQDRLQFPGMASSQCN